MTQEAAAPTLREAERSKWHKLGMDWALADACSGEGWDIARAFEAGARTALAARPADPVEPTLAELGIVYEKHDDFHTFQIPAHPGVYVSSKDRAVACGAVLSSLAKIVELDATPAEPSSRERWNAENPGELSLHTFDDDATPAEPSVRAALEALLEHCGKQGWWLQSHAIKVMDDANVALSARATLTTIPSATEPAHLAVKLAAFREAIRGHIGGEEYALISEVVRAIASRATEPDRNAALTDDIRRVIAYHLRVKNNWRHNATAGWIAGADHSSQNLIEGIDAILATRTTTKD